MKVEGVEMDNEVLEALLDKAGEKGGAVLEEIGKTDLATLSRDEWLYFLHEVADGFLAAAYTDCRIALSENFVPF